VRRSIFRQSPYGRGTRRVATVDRSGSPTQVLRAYDRQGRICGGRLHDGTDPEAVIAELFADPQVRQLHSRNVVYGCFMFVVERAAG
jgi:hypothetical protein